MSLPGTGTVSTYWGRRLDESVRTAAGRGLVVDLRSSTYASFWRPAPDLARKVVTLRVLHEVDGTRKVVSHFNKATKGRIVRALLEDGTAPGTPARFADHLRYAGLDGRGGRRPAGTAPGSTWSSATCEGGVRRARVEHPQRGVRLRRAGKKDSTVTEAGAISIR